jgi:hypothetical protein
VRWGFAVTPHLFYGGQWAVVFCFGGLGQVCIILFIWIAFCSYECPGFACEYIVACLHPISSGTSVLISWNGLVRARTDINSDNGGLSALYTLRATTPAVRTALVKLLGDGFTVLEEKSDSLVIRFGPRSLSLDLASMLRGVLARKEFKDVIKTGVNSAAGGACESGRRREWAAAARPPYARGWARPRPAPRCD